MQCFAANTLSLLLNGRRRRRGLRWSKPINIGSVLRLPLLPLPLLLLTRDPDDQPDQGEAGRRRMIIIRPSAHAPRRRCAAVSEKLSPGARARRAAPRKHACDANVLFHDRAQQLQTINYVFLAGRRCDDTAATATRPGAGYQIAACASARAMCVPGVCE